MRRLRRMASMVSSIEESCRPDPRGTLMQRVQLRMENLTWYRLWFHGRARRRARDVVEGRLWRRIGFRVRLIEGSYADDQ